MSDGSPIERADQWVRAQTSGPADLALLGAPIGRASMSASQAWTTPPAFRAALTRFPTWDADTDTDLTGLRMRDLGDVIGDEADVDATAAHRRIEAAVSASLEVAPVLVVVGGDNSLTRPALLGLSGRRLGDDWGLLTLDAHHDTRPLVDGVSRNGTPVRELIEAGLPGTRVAQVGIHGFGNARSTARWATAAGIHIHPLPEVRGRGVLPVIKTALAEMRAAGARRIYVDLDVDVVDRAYAPACPASLPGGLSPSEVAAAARALGQQPDVVALDLTEVDASTDVAAITVRLVGLLFMSFCAGVARRR
ncbi:MAG: arginase family protein [Candidatus Dormibacteria bacterium]